MAMNVASPSGKLCRMMAAPAISAVFISDRCLDGSSSRTESAAACFSLDLRPAALGNSPPVDSSAGTKSSSGLVPPTPNGAINATSAAPSGSASPLIRCITRSSTYLGAAQAADGPSGLAVVEGLHTTRARCVPARAEHVCVGEREVGMVGWATRARSRAAAHVSTMPAKKVAMVQ